jgi:hypothetical protein
MRCDSRAVPTIGERIRLTLDGSTAHGFNPDTGLRLD